MSNEGKDEDLDRVKKVCESLGEHFDSVQIFVTRHEPGTEDGTINIAWSTGNWFTRYGQIHEWLIRADERTRAYVRKSEE